MYTYIRCRFSLSSQISVSAVLFLYFNRNSQFLNNVIINKTKVLLPQSLVTLVNFGCSVLFLATNDFLNYLTFKYVCFERT